MRRPLPTRHPIGADPLRSVVSRDPIPTGTIFDTHRNAPETSRAMAEELAKSIGPKSRRVLQAIHAAGASGLTDEEGQSATGIGGNSYRPIRVRLVRLGHVSDDGIRRKVASGLEAVAWRSRIGGGS